MMTRFFLVLIALLFFAFGLWSLLDPAGMTTRLGVQVTGISGIFEMRGVYGGVSLGAALLCALGALKNRFTFPALCFLSAYMGGYIIGRIASFVAGDTALITSWIFAGFEAVVFLVSTAILLRKS